MEHLGLDSLGDLMFIEHQNGCRYDPNDSFHRFPQKNGWKINNKYGCEPIGSPRAPFVAFMQAWLFFGLLHAVLADSHDTLDVYSLFQASGYVSTERLGGCLRTWEQFERREWENCGENPGDREKHSIRMVRIQMALDRARGVVQRYCSAEGVQPASKEEYPAPERMEMDKFKRISLSLIVLGETLSNAKAKIVDRVGFTIRGWHGEKSAEGWGTSLLLREKLRAEWCPKTLKMLEGQFRGNTTGLLAAYSLRFFNGHNHQDGRCTTDICRFTNVDDEDNYVVTHHGRLCEQEGGADCGWDGPEPQELVEIISRGEIPLFLLKEPANGGSHSTIEVTVTSDRNHKAYATVSHVWSDGYGNPTRNKLRKCQLRFLKEALDRAREQMGDESELPFWMDTLAIPVGPDYRNERTLSIGRIHDIFVRSRYTVVVDGKLSDTMAGRNYHRIAMSILASGWMRRLWTLQEAYLSRRIFFHFKERTVELDKLESMYPDEYEQLNSNIPTIARSYFHSLLGIQRKARIHDMTPREGLKLIASVWKATQWRTTAKKKHEVLALATLFNLNFGNAQLNEAFVAEDDGQNLEENMCLLLKLLHDFYPGSIPAGMIFLPGRRLSKSGFGWAPRTWTSAKEVDFPDPLSLDTAEAELVPGSGLSVQFPGFLLHSSPETNQTILMADGGPLRFPSDSSLTEWYEITKADEHENEGSLVQASQTVFKRYAIILPRQRPRDTKEIALLVELIRPQTQRSFHHDKEIRILYVSIVFRIWIKRAMNLDSRDIDELYGIGVPKEVFGEILDDKQKWVVDKKKDESNIPSAGPSESKGNDGGSKPSKLGGNFSGATSKRPKSMYSSQQQSALGSKRPTNSSPRKAGVGSSSNPRTSKKRSDLRIAPN